LFCGGGGKKTFAEKRRRRWQDFSEMEVFFRIFCGKKAENFKSYIELKEQM